MNSRRFFLLIITWLLALGTADSASAPLQTLPNQSISLPAVSLTTNGIAGLTNVSPNLMVSAVVSNSLHGGTVSLVNTQAWVQRFNDSMYNVYNLDMAIDRAGNVVVTGTTENYDGSDNLVTIKYSPSGVALWTNRITGPPSQDSFGGRIGLDGSDNVYITGNLPAFGNGNQIVFAKYSSVGQAVWTNYFKAANTNSIETGLLIINPGGSSYMEISYSTGSTPLPSIIVSCDAFGAAQWTNVYGGGDYPNAMTRDANDNLFVAGGVQNLGEDMATIKFTPAGIPLWTNRFDRALIDQPAYATVDSSGNVVVTGDSMTSSNHYYVTVEYSNDGAPKWTNVIEGPIYQGGGVPLVVADLHGNVFITGGTAGADGEAADFTIQKLTSDGVPVWTNRFQDVNGGNPFPAGTAVDNAGNFYFCGHSMGPTGSNINYVTIKYLADGTPAWTNRYNGPGDGGDYPDAIRVDHAGNVYATGQSAGIFGTWDFATIKYADYLVYTPPVNFIGTDTVTFTVVDALGNVATNSVPVSVLPASLYFNPSTNLQFGAQGFQMRVDGASGSGPVVLLRSLDMVNWQPIFTNFPFQGSVQFSDTNLTNQRAYYRAMQVQ